MGRGFGCAAGQEAEGAEQREARNGGGIHKLPANLSETPRCGYGVSPAPIRAIRGEQNPAISKNPRSKLRGIGPNPPYAIRQFFVAASVSERTSHHSLTLAATLQPSRSKLRASDPKGMKTGRSFTL